MLDESKLEPYDPTPFNEINRLRRAMVVHSYIYYKLNRNIISDAEFDARAMQLVKLQADYPEISESVPYELEAFRDFEGSTGFNLPYNDRTHNLAMSLLMKRGMIEDA
ncbi:DNA ligase [Rhodococcus phage Weasels2]|uniref:DNA ligase n=1 Tax=Rhodococcus phage Weasels2 TaxID=1897437 RepID=A0A1I9SAE6_9CAUD|nr:DNA ligase [Rhodococcus phage Weasels2]AOZ63752.1 DNA ligase [Rhodococcus phage Weasels2]